MNGRFLQEEAAHIPISTSASQYGMGIFEGILCFRKNIFRLREHIKRFFHSTKLLNIQIGYSSNHIERAVVDLVRVSCGDSFYIRPIALKDADFVNFTLAPSQGTLAILLRRFNSHFFVISMRKRVKLVPWQIGNLGDEIMTNKISGKYAIYLLMKNVVQRQGYGDVLMLDDHGNVLETTGANIFFIRDDVFFTPRSDLILHGITRESIIKILRDAGYGVRKRKISIDEVEEFDEAFLTSSARGIISVHSIGNNRFGCRLTGWVRNMYVRVLEGKEERYANWLTRVS
jgi:branched-chain amino acid aminotransferase